MVAFPNATPLPHLAVADSRFREAGVERRSLAPDRRWAPEFAELGASLLDGTQAPDVIAAFDLGLAQVAAAVLENFPGNVFWDLDRLAAEMLARGDASRIAVMAAQVVRLQCGFGRHDEISFRYAHDFLFGFDWARWVARDPQARGSVLPFDDALLAYLEQRMRELRELIAADDAKYPRLSPAERWRNPFGFSREPIDETRLLERLAAVGDVPVHSWHPSGAFDWRRSYGELRREAAVALGIACEK